METDIKTTSGVPETPSFFSPKFIDPEAVINQLQLPVGAVVADFGCGSGYFSLPVAKKIGKDGTVFSLDILPQSLESVASRAKLLGITNIITNRVNLEKLGGSKLPDDSMDLVILKDMLFQNKDKSLILSEAKRVMKKTGQILIVEWDPADSSIGPERSLRISKEALLEVAQGNGLGISQELQAGDFHYGLILSK